VSRDNLFERPVERLRHEPGHAPAVKIIGSALKRTFSDLLSLSCR
jgi:hypothetical protein